MKKRHAAVEEAYAAQVRGPPCPYLSEPRAFLSTTHDAQKPLGKKAFYRFDRTWRPTAVSLFSCESLGMAVRCRGTSAAVLATDLLSSFKTSGPQGDALRPRLNRNPRASESLIQRNQLRQIYCFAGLGPP